MGIIWHFRCARCGSSFYFCPSCWRGDKYCSEPCRASTLKERRQRSGGRYRRTEKGKERQAKAKAAFLERRAL